MALNMDDLIGSMQHGFHAGDRGNDLNEIRESLKLSLGQQTPTAGPSNSQYQPQQQQYLAPRRNPPFPPHHGSQAGGGSSSLDADVAMLSSSSSSQPYQQQYYAQEQSPAFFGGPGSWGSQSSTSSSNFAIGGAAGPWGCAPAPANTPQQTPVETSALARQLQAELERQASQSSSISPPPSHSQYTRQHLSSPPLNNIPHSSPPSSAGQNTRIGLAGTDDPRSYVNGFSPTREDSATPTGDLLRNSLSPQLGNSSRLGGGGGGGGGGGHGQ
ncbi:uncharacterized protein UTRI_01071_B [Ustilago trichophora]|uniref:Uncharacterized protein n=1 Tax=Ustilago trichophora TaxID=86804 RepID=A0A5C3DW61_9BASI|nr:uncharacterized protein UTRI_01071_B [Ustilago trichophora]